MRFSSAWWRHDYDKRVLIRICEHSKVCFVNAVWSTTRDLQNVWPHETGHGKRSCMTNPLNVWRAAYPSDLTNDEGMRIEDMIPPPMWIANLQEPFYRPREIMNAIRYRLRTGLFMAANSARFSSVAFRFSPVRAMVERGRDREYP